MKKTKTTLQLLKQNKFRKSYQKNWYENHHFFTIPLGIVSNFLNSIKFVYRIFFIEYIRYLAIAITNFQTSMIFSCIL